MCTYLHVFLYVYLCVYLHVYLRVCMSSCMCTCVCCCSVAQSRPTVCNPVDDRKPSFPVLSHLLKLAQIHVHQVSDAIQPSFPLSSPSPPAFNTLASGSFLMSRLFAKVDRWPKYWSFSISPSNEYSGLISFRIDWFDLLAVQGAHKCLL